MGTHTHTHIHKTKKQAPVMRSRLGRRATVVVLEEAAGRSREGPYSGCEGMRMVERRVPELQRGTQRRCRWTCRWAGCREMEIVTVVSPFPSPQQATDTVGVQEQERRVPLKFNTDMVWVAGVQRTALWQHAGSGAMQAWCASARARCKKRGNDSGLDMFVLQWGQRVSFLFDGGIGDQWQAGDKLR